MNLFVYCRNLQKEDVEMAGKLAPSISVSATCKAVLSSNKVSPPNIAPRNNPSSFKHDLTFFNTPGRSFTQ